MPQEHPKQKKHGKKKASKSKKKTVQITVAKPNAKQKRVKKLYAVPQSVPINPTASNPTFPPAFKGATASYMSNSEMTRYQHPSVMTSYAPVAEGATSAVSRALLPAQSVADSVSQGQQTFVKVEEIPPSNPVVGYVRDDLRFDDFLERRMKELLSLNDQKPVKSKSMISDATMRSESVAPAASSNTVIMADSEVSVPKGAKEPLGKTRASKAAMLDEDAMMTAKEEKDRKEAEKRRKEEEKLRKKIEKEAAAEEKKKAGELKKNAGKIVEQMKGIFEGVNEKTAPTAIRPPEEKKKPERPQEVAAATNIFPNLPMDTEETIRIDSNVPAALPMNTKPPGKQLQDAELQTNPANLQSVATELLTIKPDSRPLEYSEPENVFDFAGSVPRQKDMQVRFINTLTYDQDHPKTLPNVGTILHFPNITGDVRERPNDNNEVINYLPKEKKPIKKNKDFMDEIKKPRRFTMGSSEPIEKS